MRVSLILFYLFFSLHLQGQCRSLGSRINVKHIQNSANTSYLLELDVLLDEVGNCGTFSNGLTYDIYTSCGYHAQRTIYPDTVIERDSTYELCLPTEHYSHGNLRNYHFTDSFSLDTVAYCKHVLIYYQGTPVHYRNMDTTAGLLPDVSWVQLQPQYRKEFLNWTGHHQVEEACVNQKRFFAPATKRYFQDSVQILQGNAILYDTAGQGFLNPVTHGFAFPFHPSMPLAAKDFDVKNNIIRFTPTDTGFYALPVRVIEWKANSQFFPFRVNSATSYYQIPVYIGDNCFRDLYYFGIFDEDTTQLDCKQRTVTIPLTTKILSSSISPDGTDFKFESSNGYPVIIHKVHIPDDVLYVDELKMDIQFFFDDLYELKIVSGTDTNTVFNECGYELQESDIYRLELYDCPNMIDLDTPELTTEVDIYPNPFQKRLIVDIDGSRARSASIVNSLGERKDLAIHTEDRRTILEVDVPAGVYTLCLELMDGTQKTFKVVRF